MPKKVKRGFTFNTMEVKAPGYSRFNLSHDKIQAIEAGKLVPLWWTEIVPGDVFQVRYSGFMRLLALSSPMLQRQDIFVRAFFVPFRILANQDDIDKLFAGSKNGEHLDVPQTVLNPGSMHVGSLYDYMDLPLPLVYDSSTHQWSEDGNANYEKEVSIFPFLAYHRIYHDHFRNEETEDDFLDLFKHHFSDLDGVYSNTRLTDIDPSAPPYTVDSLHSVCWERDYYTSALASTQRGSEVEIPITGTASVTGSLAPKFSQLPGGVGNEPVEIAPNGQLFREGSSTPLNWHQPNLLVNGSSFTGVGAIALRLAMNLQAFMERNNIAGYRMIGNTLAHFGVQSSNKLNDEAQYLGGIKAPITISAISQTSATSENSTPQGNQVGQGIASFSDSLFNYFRSEERGILMIVGYINSKPSYSFGLPKKWMRRSYLDFYWPEFQSIGEQEILNSEVYMNYDSDSEDNNGTWAYQSRYCEYKYESDSIAGEFRTSLSYWHQSRMFSSLPAFNNSFVTSNPSNRVFALDDYPRPYLLESYFEVNTLRPMDKYAQSKLW